MLSTVSTACLDLDFSSDFLFVRNRLCISWFFWRGTACVQSCV